VFDHVAIRASDRVASVRFYDTVLAAAGIERSFAAEALDGWGEFLVVDGDFVTHGLHVGFGAPDTATVDAFHRAGVEAGYRSDGDPGPRPEYGPDYYGGFLLDPDGNSVEAVYTDDAASGVDHLWLRVADLAAARDFYAAIAPFTAFALNRDQPERAQFASGPTTFSVVAGEPPTERAHIAFAAPDTATVDGFHAAGLGAGGTDNGAPGPRGHGYAAFVIDPDGNNIELVFHE
jgi:catechol 2,3-dioxygenase-like lactoylglutathione lyase family enzyme